MLFLDFFFSSKNSNHLLTLFVYIILFYFLTFDVKDKEIITWEVTENYVFLQEDKILTILISFNDNFQWFFLI